MKFVQQIRFKTNDIDAVQKVVDDFDSGEAPGNPQAWVLRDRDNAGSYIVSVVFESFDEAMKNNDRPETQELAARIGELVTDRTYENLDLIAEIV